ncbi:unnamed protein product [Cuscuta epithymum]|uniref:Peroxygenase 5 n=1 Tax=Cuscuta epithymum TaxID=186058 RepID=A0AAV0CEX8_9ASTE|nr:unnamed protein product [Cuscuta epithymum]CAH9145140.1 unnamed protein product [Cuscuta epithymum]
MTGGSSSSLNTTPVCHDGTGNPCDQLPALQKHVMFFDINQDGIVYPWETYQGFRILGFGIPLSTFAALFINIGLSKKTRPGKWPSPLFPIEVKNIKFAKRASDSGVLDSEGRFVLSKFEEFFKKHARSSANGFTSKDLDQMLKETKKPNDFMGGIAAFSEWKVFYLLAKDKHGFLTKEAIRGVYDGSLFETIAKERATK